MFRNAQDAKSNLILTTLSYMDHYSPRFGYFENVPGFLRYALNADQVDVHTTRGGVQSGGLKLFVRALLDMKYVDAFFPFSFSMLISIKLSSPYWPITSRSLWDTTTTCPIFYCGCKGGPSAARFSGTNARFPRE